MRAKVSPSTAIAELPGALSCGLNKVGEVSMKLRTKPGGAVPEDKERGEKQGEEGDKGEWDPA